jgi:hypothetical protein
MFGLCIPCYALRYVCHRKSYQPHLVNPETKFHTAIDTNLTSFPKEQEGKM